MVQDSQATALYRYESHYVILGVSEPLQFLMKHSGKSLLLSSCQDGHGQIRPDYSQTQACDAQGAELASTCVPSVHLNGAFTIDEPLCNDWRHRHDNGSGWYRRPPSFHFSSEDSSQILSNVSTNPKEGVLWGIGTFKRTPLTTGARLSSVVPPVHQNYYLAVVEKAQPDIGTPRASLDEVCC